MAILYKIGIISDTHGVLPNEIFNVFQGVDQIIHAGDIGSEALLIELETIAPVLAVFGNMDGFRLRKHINERLDFRMYGFNFIVTHFPGEFAPDHEPVVRIHGHTHKPKIVKKNNSFMINPGSASQPRGVVERSVALLTIAAPGQADVDLFCF